MPFVFFLASARSDMRLMMGVLASALGIGLVAPVALQAAARGHATRRQLLRRTDEWGVDEAATDEAATGEAGADAEAADVELMAKARHEAAVAMQAVQRGRATRRSALRPATPPI